MIIIRAARQEVETVIRHFYPAINMYRRTRLQNVMHKEILSEEYLSAVVINCLIAEVELLINRKLVNTFGKMVSLKLSEAQGAVFYKSLIILPIEPEQVYFQVVRNKWADQLDMLLMAVGFYQRAAELKL